MSLPLESSDLPLRLALAVGSCRRIHLRAGEHEVVSLTLLEEGSTMDPPFPLGVEDVIREDFGTNYLKVEGLRAGVAGLEFCPPSPPDFEAELLEMLLRGDWIPLRGRCGDRCTPPRPLLRELLQGRLLEGVLDFLALHRVLVASRRELYEESLPGAGGVLVERRDPGVRRPRLPLRRVVLAVLARSFVLVDGGRFLDHEIQLSEVGHVGLPDRGSDPPLASPGGRSRGLRQSVCS